jgi:4-hydroxyphenylacetate 3-monooxygenase
VRKGREYLAALQDDRSVYLGGRRVSEVPTHPAFQGICRTVAALYDFAAEPANQMVVDAGGVEINKVYMIPRSQEQLRERRLAIASWSRQTHGFVGRGPDHVGGFFAGFASRPEVFARGEPRFATNVEDFYRRMASESLYVAYVIIPPQVDRSRTAKDWDTRFVQVGVVRECDGGIVVRGAQMLGTAASVADYLFVSCIVPLKPGDEDYALSFVLPLHARGLKLYCRRPYAPGAPSAFDYPLSTRFDESDALVVFDDVVVPWENVFVYRNVELVRAQFFETAAHVLGNTQAQVRLVEKLKFLLGLARKITATTRVDQIPTVQEKLGELASLSAIVEGMVIAAEATCAMRDGVAWPNPRFLYGAMGLQAELYPRVLHLVREMAGGGLLQVPDNVEQLTSAESSADMERYLGGPGVNAIERVKLFKLVWDAIGSEFGSRHHQYEMFYAGAPHVARGHAYRAYGYDEALQLAESFLNSYGLEEDAGTIASGAEAQPQITKTGGRG